MKDVPPIPEVVCVLINALSIVGVVSFGVSGAYTSSVAMTFIWCMWTAYVFWEDGSEAGEPTSEELAELDFRLDMLERELDELDRYFRYYER